MSSYGIYSSDFGPLKYLTETILYIAPNASDFFHFNLFVVLLTLDLTVIFTEQYSVQSVSIHFVKTLRRATRLAAELRLELL